MQNLIIDNRLTIPEDDRDLIETTLLEAYAGVINQSEFVKKMKCPIRGMLRGSGIMAWLKVPNLCKTIYNELKGRSIGKIGFYPSPVPGDPLKTVTIIQTFPVSNKVN